jgi:hypothetical protein
MSSKEVSDGGIRTSTPRDLVGPLTSGPGGLSSPMTAASAAAAGDGSCLVPHW